MPSLYQEEIQHTEEMQDIISTPPAWLLRWGITLFFMILVLIIGLSSIIRYPDIVKTQLKINSTNSPKPVVSKVSGKLVKLLVGNNQAVKEGQPLGYMESTANHQQVIQLQIDLKKSQEKLFKGQLFSLNNVNAPQNIQLGELQSSYQSFYQSYLSYKASIEDGFYLKKKSYLQKDLSDIMKQKDNLLLQKKLQLAEYDLAKQEYAMHQKLAEQKVEAPMELKKEEAKLLSKQYPLQQTESSLMTNSSNYSAKEKEILELDNQVNEEQSKFIQALNSLISEIDIWRSMYVLTASQSGKVSFAGIIQQNQIVDANQELFYINPGLSAYFGVMPIPQYNMGKVKEGQKVLIKLKSYPYEEYGMLIGKIKAISDIPYRDSLFMSQVEISKSGFSDLKRTVNLKNGMSAEAEIITEDASLMGRLSRSLIKMLR